MAPFLRHLFLSVGTMLLLACSDNTPPFKASPVADSPVAANFSLTDQFGQPRALTDFRGKVISLFFGFTHCPDICPTHLARQAEVMRRLGPGANDIAVLFVTLDPERDTPTVLKRYMDAFDPRFIALTGTPDETAEVARQYKIYWKKTMLPGSALVYTIDHTTNSLVIDRNGRIRLIVPHTMSASDVTEDLQRIIENP